jgi:hypothetical protein
VQNSAYKYQQAELSKLSPLLKNTQKSRHFTQSVVVGVGKQTGNYETYILFSIRSIGYVGALFRK